MYNVFLSSAVVTELKKLDRNALRLILAWFHKELEDCENPRRLGKPLKRNSDSFWRYRLGNYRIIAHISDKYIIVLSVNHRI